MDDSPSKAPHKKMYMIYGILDWDQMVSDDSELELKRAMFWYIIYGFHRLHKL